MWKRSRKCESVCVCVYICDLVSFFKEFLKNQILNILLRKPPFVPLVYRGESLGPRQEGMPFQP